MLFNWQAWAAQLKSKSIFLLLFCFSLSLIFNYYTLRGLEIWWNPFQFIDLGVHEIGHWVTRGLGLSISIASGTLFQWAFPLIFAYSFLRRNDLFGFSFVGLWLSQNLLNSSHYCLSAVDSPRVIGRIGANDMLHDWVYLFQHWLPLSLVHEISYSLWILGCFFGIAFSGVCLWGLLLKMKVLSAPEVNDSIEADFLERKN